MTAAGRGRGRGGTIRAAFARAGSRRSLVVAAAALALAGCTTIGTGPAADPASDTISGRLALRVDADAGRPAKSLTAAFDLAGDAANGTMALSTPLGSRLAEARWAPGRVTLATPQSTRSFADLASMTREVLGESVPVEAWFDWLRGRPWPGAPSRELPGGFSQLGWAVDVAALKAGSVFATRLVPPPQVTVRIRLDGAGAP